MSHSAHAGDHAHYLVDGTEFFGLSQHVFKVVQGELAFAEPGFLLGHFILIDFLLRLFDQRNHVAHAQDPAGHAVGVEFLERVEMFAGADELDGHAGNGLDRQGGPAPGVAVEFGHNHTVQLQGLVKSLGAQDRVLPGHRVDHQENLIRPHAAVDLGELSHQLLVDVQPAGRVQDKRVAAAHGGLAAALREDQQAAAVDGDRVDVAGCEYQFCRRIGINGQAELLAQDL